MSIGAPCTTCKHALAVPTGPQAANEPPNLVVLCAFEPPRVFAQWFLVKDENGKDKAELAQAHLYPQPNPNIGCRHHELALAKADAGATVNGKRILGN